MPKIEKESLQFLNELKSNNYREWFEKNKGRYLQAKQNYTDWLGALINKIDKIDDLAVSDPAKCIYRIYRDVRFSKNKEPYKTHMGALLKRSPNENKCGFYVHLEPGASFIGGGLYMLSPDQLKLIRDDIDYNATPLKTVLQSSQFKKHFGEMTGEQLQTAPKGFAKDHPEIKLLRYKQFLIGHPFNDEEVLSAGFIDEIFNLYKEALLFFAPLDKALSFTEE